MDQNPYVEQSIEIMVSRSADLELRLYMIIVELVVGLHHGINLWDGLSDPNVDFDEDEEDTVISEPPLEVDRVYYRVGFTDKPVFPLGEMHSGG